MKTIDTLVEDIYYVLDHTEDHTPDSDLSTTAGANIGIEMSKALLKRSEPREKGKLWASDLGRGCLRRHWYEFNEPEYGEKLEGHTKFKFLYGNLLEESVLYLAQEAGHKVENQQERVETEVDGWTISGRMDAVIDGVLVDVKSTSSYGFKRYKDGIDFTNDSFGYLYQLGFYKEFGSINTNDQGFVWIDKQNGHIAYTPSATPNKDELIERAEDIIYTVDQSEREVDRGYPTKPYGKSGNRVLSIGCSYCPFKQRCYRDVNNGKGLRTFIYNQGPVFMTEVKREPNVQEVGFERT